MNFDDFAALVRARRTNLMIDRAREVEPTVVQQLCELSTWAPNHKLTWPWVFAEVRGDARSRLGEACAAVMSAQGEPAPRVEKTRGKFARTPVVLVVGSEIGDSDLRTTENRDAVAAAVQTLLLGATSLGLASFWSSCPKGAEPAVAEFCGFAADTAIVAMVYLGWPTTCRRRSSGRRRASIASTDQPGRCTTDQPRSARSVHPEHVTQRIAHFAQRRVGLQRFFHRIQQIVGAARGCAQVVESRGNEG